MNPEFIILRNLTIFFASTMLLKYFLFLILAPFHAVKEELRKLKLAKMQAEGAAPYLPLVSVIIPAWNEEVGIIRTVQSILANKYPRLEIIVVNDGSTDRSDEIMREFIANGQSRPLESTARIRYFYKENGGKGTALNYALENAQGEIIMTVDADSVLHPEAITRLVRYFADPAIDAAVGNVKVAPNYSLVGLLQQLEYTFGFYFKRAHSVLNAEYIYGGACAAFRKSTTFNAIGHFDAGNKTEDIEMSLRTRYNGLNSAFMEDVICYTEGAGSVRGLLNQRLRWKKGRFDSLLRYRQMFFSLKKEHNRFLCWFILPYCLLSEIQLLFEPFGLALLLSYSVISGDYLSLALGILFIFITYLVTAWFNHEKASWKLLFIFPFTWPLFYFLVWVEWLALIKSIAMLTRGDEIKWQKWQRQGIEELGGAI